MQLVTTCDIERSAEDAPSIVLSAQGQLTADDRFIYYWSAKHFFTGAGVIVDGGALVGGTTSVLAEGLLANTALKSTDQLILVYDLFCDSGDGYSAQLIKKWYGETDNNDSIYDFERHFRTNVQKYSDMLKVYKGDITQLGYNDTRPIEILSIDVAKTPDLMLYVAKTFFPRMIPGKSIVLHQDYIFAYQPWLLIAMEMLSDFFVKVYDAPTQCTSIFLLEKTISASDIEKKLGSTGRDYYRLENARYIYQAIEKAETQTGKIILSGALAYFYLVMGHKSKAILTARRLIEQYDVPINLIELTELKSLYENELNIDLADMYKKKSRLEKLYNLVFRRISG